MNRSSPLSLERYFQRQTVRWASVGYILTLLLAVPGVLYSAKTASERQLLVVAKSAARSFRPMILQDNIRDAQYQMRKALELRTGETVIVRGPDLAPIYYLDDRDKDPRCAKVNVYCWSQGFRQVSLLYPIYFDDERQMSLYGYLELSLKPTVDVAAVSILAFLLLAAFIGQAVGLSSALNQCARQIGNQLSVWSDHLRKSPGERRMESSRPAPFIELRSMQDAVDNLYQEIERLQEHATKEGKSEGQLALLREISHDLRTPHSLLAKYFALHLDTIRSTGTLDPKEVGRIETTLKRMGDLIRQVRIVPNGNKREGLPDGKIETCDISAETRTIIEDLRHDPEVLQKQIDIEWNQATSSPLSSCISRVAYYRLLENLLRNAIEASVPSGGRILVFAHSLNGKAVLTVRDNGCGIEPEIRDKIFAFDFTTKAARGTGLGLGIVEKICKECGAELSFESEVGKGTEFRVTFQRPSPRNLEVVEGRMAHVQI